MKIRSQNHHPGGVCSRRRAAMVVGGAAGLATMLPGARSFAAAEPPPIVQPGAADGAAFMARAREMRDAALASGDQGYGAVVVKDGRIVGQAPSRVVTGNDPTAHAETEANRDAARRLGTRDLSGCVMYSTSRPCAMCETAAYWGSIERLYFGEAASDAGAPRYGGC